MKLVKVKVDCTRGISGRTKNVYRILLGDLLKNGRLVDKRETGYLA